MDITQLTVLTGEQYEIEGSLDAVEAALVAASRGSIMQLAWLTERKSQSTVGINPASIVSLRPLAPDLSEPPSHG